MKITKQQFQDALSEMAQSRVTYPKQENSEKEVSDWLINWFEYDPQDAMDFRVLDKPEYDGYSDIAIMQQEWYVEELLNDPFKNALNKLGIEIEE